MQSPHSSPPQWQRRWQDRIALWQSIHTPVESTNFMNCRLWPGWEFLVRQIPCCHFVSNKLLVCSKQFSLLWGLWNSRLPSGLRLKGTTAPLCCCPQSIMPGAHHSFLYCHLPCANDFCAFCAGMFLNTPATTAGKKVVKILLECFLKGNTSHLHCLWK